MPMVKEGMAHIPTMKLNSQLSFMDSFNLWLYGIAVDSLLGCHGDYEGGREGGRMFPAGS